MAGNFVPRSDGSSSLGTTDKAFSNLYAKAGNITGELIVGSIKKSDGSEIGGNVTAANVAVADSAGIFGSDNVEGVLNELAVKIEPQAITVNGQTVSATPIAGGYIWVGE